MDATITYDEVAALNLMPSLHSQHLVPIDVDICRVSVYLRHTIQTVVMKPGKNDRLVWDGTTRTLLALDIVLNQVTPVNREAPITLSLLAT